MNADTYRLVIAIMLAVGITIGTVLAIVSARRRQHAYQAFLDQRAEAIAKLAIVAHPIAKPPARPKR